MSSLEGKQEKAVATQGERDLNRLGAQMDAKGRALKNPNLLQLKQVSEVTGADRTNAKGLAKATASQTTGSAVPAALGGLRAGRGVNSAAYRLGVEDTGTAVGRATGATMVDTDQRLDNLDLDTKGQLAETALGGMSSSMQGLRSGVSSLGQADLVRVEHDNAQRERDADMNTQILMAGMKGASHVGARLGTTVNPQTNQLEYKPGFWGGMARAGFADDVTLENKLNDYYSMSGEEYQLEDRDTLFGGGQGLRSFYGDGRLNRLSQGSRRREASPWAAFDARYAGQR